MSEPVSQRAREAAASWAKSNSRHAQAANILRGSCDTAPIVQAFAHFEQQISAEVGWQLIESAPKDGTVVLVHIDGHAIEARFDQDAAEWEAGWWGLGFANEPTHWMPKRPEPPRARSSRRLSPRSCKGQDMTENKMTCPHCNGEGDVDDGDHPCMKCGGTGRIESPMTQDIEKLVAELRHQGRRSSETSRMMAEAKSLRQEGNTERRVDLYMWQKPEDTLEWRAADALEALSRPGYAEGIEAAAKVAESWISSLRPGSIDRMNGQLEARREIASRIRALRDTNHA